MLVNGIDEELDKEIEQVTDKHTNRPVFLTMFCWGINDEN